MSHRRRDTLPRATRKPTAAKGPVQPRRVSRREREARQRRRLYVGVAAASALVVGILLFSTLNEYVFKPRAVVVSVDGVEIRRRDYWKVRSVDLINQINQYQQFAQLVDASQQQQYITLAQQASDDLDDVWGSTDLDETTLNRMIEDQVYLQNMEELGLEVTDADVDTYILTQFQPAEAPLVPSTPTPTLIPQRAEWATQTAEAEAQGGDGALTPTPIASSGAGPIVDDAAGAPVASPVAPSVGMPPSGIAASPVDVASPVASPSAGDTGFISAGGTAGLASPVPVDPQGTPLASPVASPDDPAAATTAATPNPDQALQTAEAGYEAYQDGVFDRAHLSEGDYRRLVARPAVARDEVRAALTADVGQTAEQVHAKHILVDTQDLANSIYAGLQEPNANFEQTAIDQSNDTSTAPNGGDLGWFARGQMVDPFEQAAFSLDVGAISEPVQSEFGWHIIKVYERDPNRALSDQQLEQYRENIVNDWLAQQRGSMDISSDIEPSPTPGVSNFVPPPDAPPLPIETPEAVESSVPDASPTGGATPIADASPATADGNPVASPVADGTPRSPSSSIVPASPVATTNGASPVASPVVGGSPVPVQATPVAPPAVAPIPTASPTATTATGAASPFASPIASPEASPTSPTGTPVA